jgi:class 3 adenylate cyclase
VLPPTRYAVLEGLRIAHQQDGTGPPDLVLSSGSYNHIEVQWEDPGAALFLRRMAAFSRLIRFDMLGVGGSDRWAGPAPLPSFGDQLDAVLDAVGASRFGLIAMLDAGFGAIEYAVANPDRVSHLILYGATARITRAEDYEIGLDEAALSAMLPLLDQSWGTEAMAEANVPSRASDARFVEWYTKYMRSIGTPTELARRFGETAGRDVRGLLAEVSVPSLVLHRRDYSLVPRSHGRYVADHIPGAEYVELPGADGPLFWQEPDLALRLIERFVRGSDPGDAGSRSVLTLLFTDIADSTRRAAELGDRDWLTVLGQHDEISARHASQHGGWVVKGTGDGVLAAFRDPSAAVTAASAILSDLRRMSIEVRAGIHAGEVVLSGETVSGLGVHIAARVMAEARPNEILVSRTVRDLMAGSAVTFADAGVHEMKGIVEPWQLYRVEAPSG